MDSYVALLYSIVAGKGRRITKTDLLAAADSCGFRNAHTTMSTGNLVFEEKAIDIASIEHRIEDIIARNCGKHIDVIVRPASSWSNLMEANPFPDAAEQDSTSVAVRVMRHPLDSDFSDKLVGRVNGEVVAVVNGDLWAWFPSGVASSRLLNFFRTPSRQSVGTWRNWNTLRKIDSLL